MAVNITKAAIERIHKVQQKRIAGALESSNAADVPSIPLIDIGPSFDGSLSSRSAVAAQIDSACRTVGFFQIVNHGVSLSSRDGILKQAKRLFHELPSAKKEELHMRNSSIFRGWEPGGYTTVNPVDKKRPDGGHGDTEDEDDYSVESKEAFNWAYEPGLDTTGGDGKYVELDGRPPSPGRCNVWPSEDDLPGFYSAIRDYYSQTLQLARHLFRLFALALKLPEGYFDDMMTHPGGVARLIYYPPYKPKAQNGGSADGDEKPKLGLGAHSDYECFTLLLSSADPGLEILVPSISDPNKWCWIPAPVNADCLTVNIADFLMLWSKGVYKSTIHRVMNKGTRERYSVPLFFSINYDLKVAPLPMEAGKDDSDSFEPICAGEYVLERLRATL